MAPQDHFPEQHYQSEHEFGAFSFLNPTTRLYPMDQPQRKHDMAAQSDADQQAMADAKLERDTSGQHQVYQVWRSRDNRKGRHAVVLAPEYHADPKTETPQPTNSLKETLRGLGKMLFRYPIWDVSYDVAVIFTIGTA
jgi:hypothetical protein